MFTEEARLLVSATSISQSISCRQLRLDSKGRISIPSDVRRSFGLEEGDFVTLTFNFADNKITLVFDGQSGAKASTGGCGPSDPGSIDRQSGKGCRRSDIPGSGPFKRRRMQ